MTLFKYLLVLIVSLLHKTSIDGTIFYLYYLYCLSIFQRTCCFRSVSYTHLDVYKRQTCLSPSQAPLCHYTLRTVTNRPEGTFRSLRYTFGGDHPSQTTHQTVSSQQRVRTQINKGPYFNSDSTNTGVPDSKSPAYPTHQLPKFNVKL